jgi:autotransporter-associated beta strand protein
MNKDKTHSGFYFAAALKCEVFPRALHTMKNHHFQQHKINITPTSRPSLLYLAIFSILPLFALPVQAQTTLNANDSNSLIAAGTANDPGNKLNWENPHTGTDGWTGVTWTTVGNESRTSIIDVPSMGLAGNLNLSGHTRLQYLDIGYNPLLTSLNISNNTALENLYISGNTNHLLPDDLSKFPNLRVLYVYSSGLTSIDLSKIPNLSSLGARYNQLTEIDLSHNPLLASLSLSGNQLTKIDTSHQHLVYIAVNGNRLPLSQLYPLMSIPNRTLGAQNNVALDTLSGPLLPGGAGYSLASEAQFNGQNTVFTVTFANNPATPGQDYNLNGSTLQFLDRGIYQIEMQNPSIHNDGNINGPLGTDIAVVTTAPLFVLPAGVTIRWEGNPSTEWTASIVSGSGKNWFYNSTTPLVRYLNGDHVIFGDTGAGTVNIAASGVSPASVTFENGIGNYTINGVIAGTGTLTKNNGGTVTLTGANTYTGMTTVSAGTLALTGSGAISRQLTLLGGAIFDVSSGTAPSLTRLDIRGGTSPVLYKGNLNAAHSQMNFYLPADASSGSSLLNVEGSANITNSTVNIDLSGNRSRLSDNITLLNAGTLQGNPSNTTAHASQGISLVYDFDLATNGKQLLAHPHERLNPQTKALAEAFLSGVAFLNQGLDFVVDKGLSAALNALSTSAKNAAFAALGGGSLKHKTGSYIETRGYTLVAGLASSRTSDTGKLTAGAFFEHGEGDYDSYNSFSNAAKVHGKGDTEYTGLGLLAQYAFNKSSTGNLYVEGSARAGKVDTDFSSNLYDVFGQRAAYDSKTSYFSSHFGVGYILNLSELSKLNLYGQYLWSHQGGDSVKLPTGETVKFQAVDSLRTRLGAKWNYRLNPQANVYLGAAWEHEYGGKADASIYGHKLDAPRLKGNTGLAEIGLTLNPTSVQPLTLDIGVQGYGGKREGATVSFRAKYSF